MRILIIGASGFIGQYMSRRLKDTAAHAVYGTCWSWPPTVDAIPWIRVELTDRTGLEEAFAAARPEVVLHLAAMADVGMAERERERATAVNVAGTSTIARLSEQHGAKLVFVSTEYVFDGKRGYYREDEEPSPTTHYGQTKREAEQAVMDLASRWIILRTSIVYGWPPLGKQNFVPWLIQHLRSGQPYHGSAGVYRSPVYVEDLADGIARLVEGDFQGIHHVAGRDWVSMYDFAVEVAREFSLDRELVMRAPPADPAATDDRQSMPEQGRRDMLGLDCAKTMTSLGLAHPGLSEGIAKLRASPLNPGA